MIGGDEGYGHQLMDRMAEQDFHLHRVNNGSQAERNDIYANLSAEWWSTVGVLIERRMIRIPADEKLIAQMTSRRELYDSRGREKLESKADLASQGVESPDRADALIGAVMMGPGLDPYPGTRTAATGLDSRHAANWRLFSCGLAGPIQHRLSHLGNMPVRAVI
jgi:hypothetical protein